jgi:hypothetical protein
MSNGAKAKIAILIFFGTLACLFFYMIDVGISFDHVRQQEQSWATTEATIIEQATRVEARSANAWRPVWTYTYFVGSKLFTARSSDMALGDGTLHYRSKERAEVAASSRPIGAKVIVFYDPADPQHSVLDRLNPKESSETAMWRLIVIFVGFLSLSVIWQRWRRGNSIPK